MTPLPSELPCHLSEVPWCLRLFSTTNKMPLQLKNPFIFPSDADFKISSFATSFLPRPVFFSLPYLRISTSPDFIQTGVPAGARPHPRSAVLCRGRPRPGQRVRLLALQPAHQISKRTCALTRAVVKQWPAANGRRVGGGRQRSRRSGRRAAKGGQGRRPACCSLLRLSGASTSSRALADAPRAIGLPPQTTQRAGRGHFHTRCALQARRGSTLGAQSADEAVLQPPPARSPTAHGDCVPTLLRAGPAWQRP